MPARIPWFIRSQSATRIVEGLAVQTLGAGFDVGTPAFEVGDLVVDLDKEFLRAGDVGLGVGRGDGELLGCRFSCNGFARVVQGGGCPS